MVGVVYITSMKRPDAALALAMLYGFQGKKESRMGSVCVDGSGLGAAVFCDIMGRFYMPGPMRNANDVLPTGLALTDPLPADPPMVRTALSGPYARSLAKVSDTSLAEAVIRNGVIFNAEAVMILSAPATSLAKSLDLRGVKDLYKERVRMLVVVDSGEAQDAVAMRRVLAEFPAPIVYCDKPMGDQALYPSASIEKDFLSWSEGHHPVYDAYTTFQPMPYDAPAYDMAAALHVVRPASGLLQLSDFGTLAVDDGGALNFTRGGAGKVRALAIDPAKRDRLIATYIEAASNRPVQPAQRQKKP